jgi:SAM-dependent methyltransferase
MSIIPPTSPVPPAPPVVHHTTCRVCGGSLETVIDLGIHQLSTFPETPDGIIGPAAPLVLTACQGHCGLFQLADTVSPELLYREYWYRSGVNEMMRANLKDVVAQALRTVDVHADDFVLDIGANDGTLLSYYRQHGAQARRVAVEPARNVRAALEKNAAPGFVYDGFFPVRSNVGMGPLAHDGVFKVITSIAMFYDLEDPNAFVAEIRRILAPDGIWILEVGYLPWMLERGVFDMICHEHLEYYTLDVLSDILLHHELEIVDASLNETNGQSLRLVVTHEASSLPRASGITVRFEAASGLDSILEREVKLVTPAKIDRFRQKVESLKRRIVELIEQALELGWVIDLYGASTKGNTLLQYCELGYPDIRQALDRAPEKWGRYTVGSGIPIISDQNSVFAYAGRADLLLCPIWQFKPAVLERERAYLESGGRILFPMPEPEIVKMDGTS